MGSDMLPDTRALFPILDHLHCLALHVLSICLTAANCKQLFSVLSLIMSDQCTCLCMDTLMNIAELQLHLHDEYMQK